MEYFPFFIISLLGMGLFCANGGDIIMVRPPVWIRRVLYIMDIKRPLLPLYSVIWQIFTYMLLFFLLFCYLTLPTQEFEEVFRGIWRLFVPIMLIMLAYFTILTIIMRERQIERVIGNHFARDIWLSSSRKIFDAKYKYAEKRMKPFLSSRKIRIMKAKDIYGRPAFKHTKENPIPINVKIPVPHWYKYDPLAQREQYFIPDLYYFYAPKFPGLIAVIESEMREKWKHDAGKKKKFWYHGRSMGRYGPSTEWR